MGELELLAILSVEKNKSIRCQIDGCGRPVHRAIHVLKSNGEILLCGSGCYDKLCGGKEVRPSYGSWGESVLTDEQRQVLLDNTEDLLQQLKAKYEREIKKVEAPLPAPIKVVEPVKKPPYKATNLEYETERNLMCMSCWTSFRSKVRRCPTCQKINSVLTQAC